MKGRGNEGDIKWRRGNKGDIEQIGGKIREIKNKVDREWRSDRTNSTEN